jgi:hypothetical protein
MRPFVPLVFALVLFIAAAARAEDAEEFRAKGIAALKESQTNPRAIVDAARHFVNAAELYGAAGDEAKNVEMNSFLYWCKKKMSMQDIDAFTKGGEAAVSTKLVAVEKLAPKANEAQPWFDRAEQFATANPDEHLLIAIRFFEVADRFKTSEPGLKAMDRSLKELVQDKSVPKGAIPPVAVAAPKSAPTTGGNQPVPAVEKIKEAEKLIKDLFKAEYAQTDAPGRLALAGKLLQQADENKSDAASEYVLLRDARDLAVAAGDIAKATTAQKRLRDDFSFDFAAILADLKRLEATAKTDTSASALVTLYSAAAEDALEADNLEQAVRFDSHVDDLLPLIKDAALKARLKTKIATAQALKRDSIPALAAHKTLATKPDDPEANLAAGKFALQRGKFGAAFALLAKSKDAALSGLAKRELAPPTDAAEQVKLADGWFDRSEKEPYAFLKVRMQERAKLWYGNALPVLIGLTKAKVVERLKVLTPVPKTELGNTAVSKFANGTHSATPAITADTHVNLLKLIDISKDRVFGVWDMTGGELKSDSGAGARVEFPYAPPEEYDFKISFTRLEGADFVSQIMPIAQHSFMWVMGNSGNSQSDFEGTGDRVNFRIQNGKKYSCTVQVRKSGIKTLVNDKLVAQTDKVEKVTVSEFFRLRNPELVGVCTWGSPTVFHSAEIIEVNGRGKFLRVEREEAPISPLDGKSSKQ